MASGFSATVLFSPGLAGLLSHFEEDTMSKTYTCRDVGVDCDWKTSAETEDEVMATIRQHAAQVHPAVELTPELVDLVRGAIKDG